MLPRVCAWLSREVHAASLHSLMWKYAGKQVLHRTPTDATTQAFIGFAPMNDPKIAICVYVENAGFGATYGVPIGSLMMEKYLKGEISPGRKYLEERMLESNTIIYSGVKKH